ncbi:MAG TPA: hypothetical protein VIJ41_02545 [Candidatus Nanopelagicales bacterium]
MRAPAFGVEVGFLARRTRRTLDGPGVTKLIGYPALLVGCFLDLFDVTHVTQGGGLLAIAPGGLFELILPIWLLAKGFSPRRELAPVSESRKLVSHHRPGRDRCTPLRHRREVEVRRLGLLQEHHDPMTRQTRHHPPPRLFGFADPCREARPPWRAKPRPGEHSRF